MPISVDMFHFYRNAAGLWMNFCPAATAAALPEFYGQVLFNETAAERPGRILTGFELSHSLLEQHIVFAANRAVFFGAF